MNKLDTVVLPNGLTIYLYQDTRRHSTFFQFNTNCGGISKHFIMDGKEYTIPDGVAHILEHYVVECNERGNFLEELGHMQMATNASTSMYITNYYFETVENVLFGIRTILEGVYHVVFDTQRLEKLKNPIFQEVRGKFDNRYYHAYRKRMENLFPSFDFRDVGGTLEEIQNTTIEDIQNLYHAFYQPSNQFIVMAGNFDKEEVLKEIRDFYDSVTIEKHDVEVIPYNDKKEVHKKEDSFSFPGPMDYFEYSFKIDISGYSSEELLELDFYLASFYKSSFGSTSPLYKRLVDEQVILDSINYGDSIVGDYLVITIGADTNDIPTLKEAILEEVTKLEHLNEEEFIMDKRNSIVHLILRDENIFKMIFPFINNIVYFHYPYLDTVEDVQKLTYEGYIKAIHKLDFTHYSALTIYKEKK